MRMPIENPRHHSVLKRYTHVSKKNSNKTKQVCDGHWPLEKMGHDDKECLSASVECGAQAQGLTQPLLAKLETGTSRQL